MPEKFVADNGREFELNEYGQIVGTISVDINDLIACDLEGAMNLFSEQLVGNDLLTEISYTPMAIDNGQIIVEITGGVDMILESRNSGPSI